MAPTPRDRLVPIFDFGGVLFDWSPDHLYRKVIADEAERRWFLTEVCPPEWNLRMDAGLTFAEALAERVRLFPDQEARIRVWADRWDEMIPGPIDGTSAVVEAMAATGPIYGITNFGAESFARTRSRFPILDRFTDILVSAHVGLVKPDSAIFELAIERFGVDPRRCLYIDDKAENLVVPEAMGMHVHHFTDAGALRTWLAGLGQLSETA